VNFTITPPELRRLATKELALLVSLLFFGLVVMPIIIYWVGQSVFGDYGGVGFADFFGTLSAKVRTGNIVAWILILSPYLGWQCLRLMILAWRSIGR
jgi:hypothetical protein